MRIHSEVTASVSPLYAVPLLHARLEDHSILNAELSTLFLSLQEDGEKNRGPNRFDTQYGIFESDFYLHQRRDPCVQTLFDFIRSTLLTFIQGINQYDDVAMSNMHLDIHSWFHITQNGGFQSSHNHSNASWSAIYCVDPGDSTSPESGAVRFQDPRIGSDMFRDPSNSNLQTPYKICPWQLTHKPGQLIAFPSYLVHEVFPYLGTRPRIVVALNAWSRWKAL